jgi:hypothetical protein
MFLLLLVAAASETICVCVPQGFAKWTPAQEKQPSAPVAHANGLRKDVIVSGHVLDASATAWVNFARYILSGETTKRSKKMSTIVHQIQLAFIVSDIL